MTTTGDTIYSSSGSTPARLGIGSTGNVLTVSGGVPTWAAPAGGGGITLLSTTTLSGASVTVSSISQDYQTLYIVVNGITVASGTAAFRFSTNSSTNLLSDYKIDGSVAVSREFLVSYIQLDDGVQDLGNNTNNVFVITIDNYSSTSMFKTFNIQGLYNGTSSNGRVIFGFGGIASNTEITSITAATSGNSYNAGTIKVYGVK
jgi:hypothetical protein